MMQEDDVYICELLYPVENIHLLNYNLKSQIPNIFGCHKGYKTSFFTCISKGKFTSLIN